MSITGNDMMYKSNKYIQTILYMQQNNNVKNMEVTYFTEIDVCEWKSVCVCVWEREREI